MKPTKANTQKYRLLAAIAAIVIMVGWAASLRASTPYFVSTTGSDANDCLTLATACQRITTALAKASAGDIVIVANGTYTENVTLDKDITLIGFGQDVTTINGGGIDRVMTVTAGVIADVSNFTMINGAGANGGGIHISGTLKLSRITLSGNGLHGIWNVGALDASALAINHHSVGIDNDGMATVRDSVIENNGIGVFNHGTMYLMNSAVLTQTSDTLPPGAGISNYGVMAIDHSLIRANRINSGDGGGIYNGGMLTVSNSLIISNTAFTLPRTDATAPTWLSSRGGGIRNDSFPSGLKTITNSTLYGNSANNGGDQINNGGLAVLVNVTMSGDDGHYGIDNGAWMTLTNVTISDMPSGLTTGGGNIFARNSIVTAVCIGAMTSLGHNLDSGNTCGFTATGDLTNTNPLLGPLQDNGGPTPTYALPANSPAVNAGDNIGCPTTDQRGVARPQAGRCDIGAYEYVFPVTLYLPFVAR